MRVSCEEKVQRISNISEPSKRHSEIVRTSEKEYFTGANTRFFLILAVCFLEYKKLQNESVCLISAPAYKQNVDVAEQLLWT